LLSKALETEVEDFWEPEQIFLTDKRTEEKVFNISELSLFKHISSLIKDDILEKTTTNNSTENEKVFLYKLTNYGICLVEQYRFPFIYIITFTSFGAFLPFIIQEFLKIVIQFFIK
jgi:hypothetical protein